MILPDGINLNQDLVKQDWCLENSILMPDAISFAQIIRVAGFQKHREGFFWGKKSICCELDHAWSGDVGVVGRGMNAVDRYAVCRDIDCKGASYKRSSVDINDGFSFRDSIEPL